MTRTAKKLEDVLDLVSALPPGDKRRVFDALSRQLETLAQSPERSSDRGTSLRQGSASLYGLLRDLGAGPSADDIDETRRDAWAAFPRDDL